MPRRKYYKKKKGYRKRYRKRRNPMNRPSTRSGLAGIPDSKFVKLKYTTFLNLNGGALPFAVHRFRGNGLFDPDSTGIGGQPLAFDQWANFYEKNLVYASKINVQLLNNNTTSGPGNVLINIIPTEEIVTRTYSELSDSRYNVNRLIAPVSAGSNGVYMKNYISTKKLYGDTNIDDLYEADFTSLPNRQWYWHIQADSFNETDVPNLAVKVTITYYVKLFNPRELLAS